MTNTKKQYILSKEEVTIGRRTENNIVIPRNDLLASGNHARITREKYGYKLQDTKSTNGTYVNGRLIKEKLLFDRDIILVGKTRLVFVAGDFFNINSQVTIENESFFQQPYQNIVESSLIQIEERVYELRILSHFEKRLKRSKNLNETIDGFIKLASRVDLFTEKTKQVAYLHYDEELHHLRIGKRKQNTELDIPKQMLQDALKNHVESKEIKYLVLSKNEAGRNALVIPLASREQLIGFLYFELKEDADLSPRETQIIAALSEMLSTKIETLDQLRRKSDLERASKISKRAFTSGSFQYNGPQHFIYGYGKLQAKELSGDYYNTYWREPYLYTLLGDVQVKGANAVLIISSINAFVSGLLCNFPGISPKEVATKIDQFLLETFPNMFTTMIIARWHSESGELIFVNMGHGNPIFFSLVNHDWLIAAIEANTGVPLGINKRIKRSVPEEKEMLLAKNEFVILSTDDIKEVIEEGKGANQGLNKALNSVAKAQTLEDIGKYIRKKSFVLLAKELPDINRSVALKDVLTITEDSFLVSSGNAQTDNNTAVEHIEATTNDEALGILKNLTSATKLNLSGTQITNAGLAHLKGLSNLTHLDLGGTQISDVGLVHLKELVNLCELNLEKTQISGTGLLYLKKYSKLIKLKLNNTKVGDTALPYLKALTQLQELDLRQASMTEVGLEKLQLALSNCVILT